MGELESAENCLVWKSLYCDLCKDDLCEDDFFVVLCLRWRIRWYTTAGIVNFVCVGTLYSNPLVLRTIFFQPKSQKLARNVYIVKIDRSIYTEACSYITCKLYSNIVGT